MDFTLFYDIPPHVFISCAALLGCVFGSFYAVCIYRHGAGLSLVWPPSHCPHCQERLRPWELVPVLSWLALRGRCRHCGKSIHWRYPAVEAVSGGVSALLAWKFGPSVEFCTYFFFCGMLIVASGIDFAEFLLPDVITLGGAVLALPAAPVLLGLPWKLSLAGGLVGAGMFWLVRALHGLRCGYEGMGLGDVKLMLLLGLLCGVQRLPLLVIVAGVTALAYLLLAAVATRQPAATMRVPFGPFLCAGFLTVVLAGDDIMSWWLALLAS